MTTTDRPTDPRAVLDQLDALRAAATPGPWFAWDRGVGWHLATEDPTPVEHLPGRPYLVPEGVKTDLGRAADAALIVAAVNAAPAVVAAVRAVLDLADELEREAAERDAIADRLPNQSDYHMEINRLVVAAEHQRRYAKRTRRAIAGALGDDQ